MTVDWSSTYLKQSANGPSELALSYVRKRRQQVQLLFISGWSEQVYRLYKRTVTAYIPMF
jgi:hypothetical protein